MPRPGNASTPRTSRDFRPDIQALRAVAVAAVVVDHVWPDMLPGGYTGVDVFFVVSGFLITSHLLRDAETHGRPRLLAFYGRRIRRLLPSALLVLAVAGAVVWALLPASLWRRTAAELVGAAAYVENWVLTALGANYSAASEAPTVAQHYWSLSVEEQFYLVWPAIIIAAGAIVVRLGGSKRRAVLIAIAGLGGLSFVASLIVSALIPSAAYFATYARIWEFAIGAVLAIAGPRLRARMRLARGVTTTAQAVGFAAIVAGAFLIPAGIDYPGWAALAPTIATALVIAAGTVDPELAESRVVGWRPIQWVGDVSYAIYLWHWPIVVVAPFVIRRAPTLLDQLAEVALAVALAALSYRFVEQPVRRWTWLSGRTRRTLLATAGATAVVALVAGGMVVAYYRSPFAHGEVPVAAPVTGPCQGPLALLEDCGSAAIDAAVVQPEMGPANNYAATPPDCAVDASVAIGAEGDPVLRCDFATGPADPQVWLLGDSHAQQWQWPLRDIAQREHWDLVIAVRGGCPPADVLRVPGGPADEDCRAWMRSAAGIIAAAHPAAVYTAGFSTHEAIVVPPGGDAMTTWRDGLLPFWSEWTSSGAQVVAFGDPPINANFPGQVDIPGLDRGAYCIVFHFADPGSCAAPRALVVGQDPILSAAKSLSATDPRIHPLDISRFFCDDADCYAAVGGIAVYADWNHLNPDYSRRLAPYLDFRAG